MNADGDMTFSSSRYTQRSSSVPSDAYGPSPESGVPWQIDSRALARCRELFARGELHPSDGASESFHTFIDVPFAYDAFCRAHFTAVRRLRPDMQWDDVCQIYAIALFAHAQLCVELDEDREQQLERYWPQIRGASQLPWSRARPLISDGCRALARLDPLACSR
jgi:hypothetical protein